MIVKLFADAERLRVSICGCGADADSQVLSAQVSVLYLLVRKISH